MLKLVFFVPESHLTVVKQAVFDAGAGSIGHYDQCCWQVLGQGQFRPLSGSNPHIGQMDKLEIVAEYRVEIVCEEQLIKAVVAALKQAHPYETPAYEVMALIDI